MSSNGPPGNCCKVPNKHLIGHMLGEQNGGFTTGKTILEISKSKHNEKHGYKIINKHRFGDTKSNL